MIDVALLGIIRRWHLRDQVPLREIARRLGISRNTVRRYIRAETIEPAYADRRPRSSLDKYTLKLSAWLKTEAAKSRKQRRTLKQLHLELRALGYEGSYDRVAAFARRWKVDQLERVNSASKSTPIKQNPYIALSLEFLLNDGNHKDITLITSIIIFSLGKNIQESLSNL